MNEILGEPTKEELEAIAESRKQAQAEKIASEKAAEMFERTHKKFTTYPASVSAVSAPTKDDEE